MAAFTGVSSTSLISPRVLSHECLAPTKISGLKLVSFSNSGRTNLPLSFRHLQVAPSQKTVDKVCDIVRKQLALKDDISLCGESKSAALGADSLDMSLQNAEYNHAEKKFP